jgi:hypothetical protein
MEALPLDGTMVHGDGPHASSLYLYGDVWQVRSCACWKQQMMSMQLCLGRLLLHICKGPGLPVVYAGMVLEQLLLMLMFQTLQG